MAAAKRARKDTPKTFEEHTVADFCALLAQHEKLEKRLEAKEDELGEVKASTPKQTDDPVLADRAKASIVKQFEAQMLPDKQLSEKEKDRTRGEVRLSSGSWLRTFDMTPMRGAHYLIVS